MHHHDPMTPMERATLLSSVALRGVAGVADAVADDDTAIQALIGLALASEVLLEGPDDRVGLTRALGVLGETLGFAGAGVWGVRERRGSYTVHARWRADAAPVPDSLEINAAGLEQVHARLMAGDTVEVSKADANPRLVAMLDDYGDDGFLAVPVVAADGTWGAAVFGRKRGDQRPWSTLARTSLRTVAALFGAAIRRTQEAQRAERLLEALEAAQRTEGLATLAAGIAHDISNMLGVLRTGLDLAELRGEFVPKDVARMENAFDAAKALVDELYGFAGLQEDQRVPIDLARLMRRGVALLNSRRPENVAVHVDIADDLPTVLGNVTQVGQAIGNVVLNAVEANAQSGGNVWVHATPQDRHGTPGVLLSVEDDGPGIDDAVRTRLFKPLVSSKGSRRGIGLASASSIARSHGGSLALADRDEPGARFELWLPTG